MKRLRETIGAIERSNSSTIDKTMILPVLREVDAELVALRAAVFALCQKTAISGPEITNALRRVNMNADVPGGVSSVTEEKVMEIVHGLSGSVKPGD